jgi:hypothetical protein
VDAADRPRRARRTSCNARLRPIDRLMCPHLKGLIAIGAPCIRSTFRQYTHNHGADWRLCYRVRGVTLDYGRMIRWWTICPSCFDQRRPSALGALKSGTPLRLCVSWVPGRRGLGDLPSPPMANLSRGHPSATESGSMCGALRNSSVRLEARLHVPTSQKGQDARALPATFNRSACIRAVRSTSAASSCADRKH